LAIVTSLDAPLSAEPTHVFLLPLGVAGEEAGLPPSEIERAEAEALAPSLREAFLARRRLLRRAVALRLGSGRGDVVIAPDANGAPHITSAREPIFVSLASRGGLVAIALSDRPVGIDVEIPAANPPEPAWNILHSREREWLSKQSGDEQAENFLALWCVKEAYLKAIGLGLRREPAEIAVTLLDKRQVSIEDAGRSVGLDAVYVIRREAHGARAVLAWVVLAR
jgi:4'-phosphopantetheinyl transferase